MARKKKTGWKRDAPVACDFGNRRAPAPWDAVALPLVDGFTETATGLLVRWRPKRVCDKCPAAKLVDQGRMFVLHAPIVRKKFLQVKRASEEDCSCDEPNDFLHSLDMPSNPPKPEAIAAGHRLRRTREALGIETIRRLAQLTDEDENLLQKYESGKAMPSSRLISKLKRLYGVDHNWIYDDDMRGLPHDLALKLMGKQ